MTKYIVRSEAAFTLQLLAYSGSIKKLPSHRSSRVPFNLYTTQDSVRSGRCILGRGRKSYHHNPPLSFHLNIIPLTLLFPCQNSHWYLTLGPIPVAAFCNSLIMGCFCPSLDLRGDDTGSPLSRDSPSIQKRTAFSLQLEIDQTQWVNLPLKFYGISIQS